ncbi:ATP-binding cassette domain-containing protein [Nakamurella endophytica]|uniref:Peptide ABC transporter ATP-binding protein n=1 Tax=Nakamurella endophytica TaxID=1748367 RepID=A0A917TA32_9ACTN|nr:ATP-binding cassette domain-containing protein [Nakamurella endophytica]GGM15480.1 peptide ABC transporter ATP-binding protein [Nakamurella endophytica]
MTGDLLVVQGLTKTFRGRSAPAVDDVSFTVPAGACLGLVGESGSGKSTTARLVNGLLQPDAGRVLVDGHDLAGGRDQVRGARRVMQMVFQDPYSSLDPRMTVAQLVGEPLVVHRVARSRAKLRAAAAELLETVGMGGTDLDRHPQSFSGGQRQRIAIARALAVRPRLLVCDEPVSSLDVSVQAQVLNLFNELRGRFGLSLLFIAHDLAVVRYLCERVAVMEQGRIVEIGDRDQVYEHPQHPYTRSLLAAVPVPDPAVARERLRAVAT